MNDTRQEARRNGVQRPPQVLPAGSTGMLCDAASSVEAGVRCGTSASTARCDGEWHSSHRQDQSAMTYNMRTSAVTVGVHNFLSDPIDILGSSLGRNVTL
jgi:hypothetical protein